MTLTISLRDPNCSRDDSWLKKKATESTAEPCQIKSIEVTELRLDAQGSQLLLMKDNERIPIQDGQTIFTPNYQVTFNLNTQDLGLELASSLTTDLENSFELTHSLFRKRSDSEADLDFLFPKKANHRPEGSFLSHPDILPTSDTQRSKINGNILKRLDIESHEQD